MCAKLDLREIVWWIAAHALRVFASFWPVFVTFCVFLWFLLQELVVNVLATCSFCFGVSRLVILLVQDQDIMHKKGQFLVRIDKRGYGLWMFADGLMHFLPCSSRDKVPMRGRCCQKNFAKFTLVVCRKISFPLVTLLQKLSTFAERIRRLIRVMQIYQLLFSPNTVM